MDCLLLLGAMLRGINRESLFLSSKKLEKLIVLEKIRSRIGKRGVLREVNRMKRKVKAVNLKDARNIGVLFSLDSEIEYERISRFVMQLQHTGKKVMVVGSFKYRKLPPFYSPKLSYDVITPADLDLFLRPKAKFIPPFLGQSFDMLINLGSPDDFPLYYLSTISKAGFKLGQKKGIEPWPYDLMIDMDIHNTDELIEQMVHYTSSFNMGGRAG